MLQVLLEEGFLARVAKLGNYFMAKLRELDCRCIVEVRGLGLIIGLEIEGDGAKVAKLCQEQGLLINCIGGKTLRFLPPLIIEEEHIDLAVSVLQEALTMIEK